MPAMTVRLTGEVASLVVLHRLDQQALPALLVDAEELAQLEELGRLVRLEGELAHLQTTWRSGQAHAAAHGSNAVSYTHLTLPTKA